MNKVWSENQLRLLKYSKATRSDNLLPGMLKDCSNELPGLLCYLINLFMISGTIPNEWKLTKVIPIFKYGDRTDPKNYCQISILPILLKILEQAVHSQLLDHLKKCNLLTNCQYGYRKNRSTKLASALLQDDIQKSVDHSELVGAVFIDLTKAFHTIGHEILLSKSPSYRLRLLEVWKENLTDKARKCVPIYGCTPINVYCTANLNLDRTELGRLWCLDRHVSQILGEPLTPIFNLIEKHAVLRVEKCLFVGVYASFRNYFQKLEHKVSTRNNGKLLEIPKAKFEFAFSGFFMGATIFSSLLMEVCASLADDFRK